jgi:glycosyltransferase involved in cell wall biosynthesis
MKILYLVTEDWYFVSHRLPMARAARDMGLDVVVMTRVHRHRASIEAEGFRIIPWTLQRRGMGLREANSFREVLAAYRRERPDIVHHVALKPVLYGALAARLAGVPAVVNALAGLGFAFASGAPSARFLRPAVTTLFRRLLGGDRSVLLVQNEDDSAFFRDHALVPADRVALIPGSGVDARKFAPSAEPPGTPVALLAGRMLREKGVFEAVEAARLLRARGIALRIALVGAPDPENRGSIDEHQLRQWHAEGTVAWWGVREDMPDTWRQAAIGLLPSYREGMPKALLEAAACARPLVATDVPGCRALVRDGVNGLLVPPRDPAALADALARLAADAALRNRLGSAARAIVEAEYADAVITEKIQALYRAIAP